MFGADTSLVFDALQMVGIAVVATGGAVWWLMRKPISTQDTTRHSLTEQSTEAGNLEQRVRVLERIATDGSADLADEIEALRTSDKRANSQLEGRTQ